MRFIMRVFSMTTINSERENRNIILQLSSNGVKGNASDMSCDVYISISESALHDYIKFGKRYSLDIREIEE